MDRSHCAQCHTQSLAIAVQDEHHLFLWCSETALFDQVAGHLETLAEAHELRPEDLGAVLALPPAERDAIVRALAERLGEEAAREVKVLLKPLGEAPGPRDFPHLSTLDRLVTRQRAFWLSDMLGHQRYTTYFQPIVSVHDTSQIFGHEALFRGLDELGKVIPPVHVFEVARRTNALYHADMHAVHSAVREMARHQLPRHVFINFNPASIVHPAFSLEAMLEAIDAAGMPRDRIVFEVVESDHVQDLDMLIRSLDAYRVLGFKVALDDLGSGYSSLNLIHALRPDFIKLDMALIRDVDRHVYKSTVTQKLLELADDLGVESVAEGVETEAELQWLRENGATYVQGYLIARPGSPPALATPAL
ncbi:MAG: EAL domain-containing protein [Candidatus Sericytochromatia bacterium]